MDFCYPLKEKVIFYWGYFFRKVFCLWFEVKSPKARMFIYEMLYSAKKVLNYASLYPSPFNTELVKTMFGAFRIRPHTADMSNVSPAFERRDVDCLLSLLQGLKDRGKRVLFLDIGADIGTFSVTVGNAFKDYEGLHVLAFEPAASSYALLKENITLNGLDRVTALNIALFSEDDSKVGFQFNPEAPGSSSLRPAGGTELEPETEMEKVTIRTLDTVLSERPGLYDALVFKIDVEGVEKDVLEGGRNVLGSGKEVYLMVEDFVNPQIVSYLEGLGAEFIRKLTPYNSWWKLPPSD